MPIGSSALNATWVLKPVSVNTAAQAATLATAGDGLAYIGPAYMPQPTAYSIPAGVSAFMDTNQTRILGAIVERVVYDVIWDVR